MANNGYAAQQAAHLANLMQDYPPSVNRGPGNMDALEAGVMRQIASQHETVSKKRKIALESAGTGDASIIKNVTSIFGEGMKKVMFHSGRHRYSKKGRFVPEYTENYIAQVYGKDWKDKYEEPHVAEYPKFDVDPWDPTKTIGENYSPGVKPEKALNMGLTSQLRNDLPPNAGMLISYSAVNLRQEVILHLTNSRAPGDNAPITEDEIMSAMLLGVAYSKHNMETHNPADRKAVRKLF